MVAARRVLKRLIRKEIGGGRRDEIVVYFVGEVEGEGGVVVEMLKMRAIFLLGK
jgi:hypothetical protein